MKTYSTVVNICTVYWYSTKDNVKKKIKRM